MKKLFFTLLLIPTFVFAQTKGFTITGNITGLEDGEVKLTSTQDQTVVASGTAKGGVFSMQGTVAEPGLYWLNMGKEQPQYLFLENASIKITGSKAALANLKVEGSSSHKDFMQFQKVFN
ncbi:MAG TPA: DUF4369 domain-containing protein, partial [Flavisolibacter sp.]|nr:DUF4369 domain-containing protein [Flavisolibacter sp.]